MTNSARMGKNDVVLEAIPSLDQAIEELSAEQLERLDHFRKIIESGTISERRSSISLEREGSISEKVKRMSLECSSENGDASVSGDSRGELSEREVAELAEMEKQASLQKTKKKERVIGLPPGAPPAVFQGDTHVLNEEDKSYCTDLTLLRYLRARNWNLKKAVAMLTKTLQWRNAVKINKISVSDPKIDSAYLQGKMYINGYDKRGQPIVYLKMHTKADPHTNTEKIRFMMYTMNSAIKAMDEKAGIHKMVWIANLENYSMKYNGDLNMAVDLLHVVQNYYPERLAHAFFVNAPLLFRAAWKTISPFVDSVTKKKIKFVGSKDKFKVLNEYIDASVIEKCLGGESDYQYGYDDYVEYLSFQETWPRDIFLPFSPPNSTALKYYTKLELLNEVAKKSKVIFAGRVQINVDDNGEVVQ
eukprot:Nk52_evm38s229 gene=Nk52_evmTU38s229